MTDATANAEHQSTTSARALNAAAEAIFVGGGTSDPDLIALAESVARVDANMAVLAFLRAMPPGIDCGTARAEVEAVCNGQ